MGVFGGVLPHHDHRCVILPAHQQPRLFPDRHRDRAEHAGHALGLQPFLCLGEQCLGDLGIVGVEITEHACARAHALFRGDGQRKVIDMRADPAHRLAAALGDEQLDVRVLEERVLVGMDKLDLLRAHLRHEVRDLRGKAAAKIDEGRTILRFRRVERQDGYVGHEYPSNQATARLFSLARARRRGWPVALPPDRSLTHG